MDGREGQYSSAEVFSPTFPVRRNSVASPLAQGRTPKTFRFRAPLKNPFIKKKLKVRAPAKLPCALLSNRIDAETTLLHHCGQRGNASAAAEAAPRRVSSAALTNASALNATGEALDLNDAHDNATATANATATNKTDEGLRASIKAYFRGAKELWGDVKTWRRLRREAKNGTNMILSWHERRVKSKTIPHSLRMLPILANPLPPPFGLVLVGIASLVPRTLLTPEFWTDGQALTFATEDGADVKSATPNYWTRWQRRPAATARLGVMEVLMLWVMWEARSARAHP